MKTLLYSIVILLSISCATHNDIKIIAHRGASGYLPEHTLAAVAMAHSWDVDFIEPDIVLSRDNVPVVLHDIHLDTTTNVKSVYPNRKRGDGRYYAIDFTYQELKKLRVHERIDLKTGRRVFENRFPLNSIEFRIPSLEEYIQLVQGLNISRNRKIGLIPEIKSPAFHRWHKQDISKIVLGILKKYKLDKRSDRFYLQCFDPMELKRIRYTLRSKVNLVQLIGDNSWKEASCDYDHMVTKKGIKEISEYAQVISPWLSPFFKNNNLKTFTAISHSNALKVIPYTIRIDSLPKSLSEAKLYELLKDADVDGVFTDFGDRLVKSL